MCFVDLSLRVAGVVAGSGSVVNKRKALGTEGGSRGAAVPWFGPTVHWQSQTLPAIWQRTMPQTPLYTLRRGCRRPPFCAQPRTVFPAHQNSVVILGILLSTYKQPTCTCCTVARAFPSEPLHIRPRLLGLWALCWYLLDRGSHKPWSKSRHNRTELCTNCIGNCNRITCGNLLRDRAKQYECEQG